MTPAFNDLLASVCDYDTDDPRFGNLDQLERIVDASAGEQLDGSLADAVDEASEFLKSGYEHEERTGSSGYLSEAIEYLEPILDAHQRSHPSSSDSSSLRRMTSSR